MITVKNLGKNFGELQVLKNVNCEIEKGEVISVIGPSGCGKSTLLRCINLMETPTEGQIFIDGKEITAKGADLGLARRKMGMVFQSFNLYSHLMIAENIMLAPVQLLKQKKQEAYDNALHYLELVGLKDKALAFPDELSGGQKQRVAIARTLAMNPDLILMDEPTSALDPTMVSEVLAVIRNLAKEGLTMLIVTHEMKFAKDVSSRLFYMDDCGIYEEGAPEQIFENPIREKTRNFILRIRAFNYNITTVSFDLYEMNGLLETFCSKHTVAPSRVNKLELVMEELIVNGILPHSIAERININVSVSYFELSNDIRLSVSFDGEDFNPVGTDEISAHIMRKYLKNITYQYADGKGRIESTLAV